MRWLLVRTDGKEKRGYNVWIERDPGAANRRAEGAWDVTGGILHVSSENHLYNDYIWVREDLVERVDPR